MGQVMSQACRPCFTGEDIDDPFSDEPAPLAIPREFEDAEEVRQRSPSPVRKYVTEGVPGSPQRLERLGHSGAHVVGGTKYPDTPGKRMQLAADLSEGSQDSGLQWGEPSDSTGGVCSGAWQGHGT